MFTDKPEIITVTAPPGPLGIGLSCTIPSVLSEVDADSPCATVPPGGEYFLSKINDIDVASMRHQEVVGLVQEFSQQERMLVFELLTGRYLPIKDTATEPATPEQVRAKEEQAAYEAALASKYNATTDEKAGADAPAEAPSSADNADVPPIYPDPNSQPPANGKADAGPTLVVPPEDVQLVPEPSSSDATIGAAQSSAVMAETTSPTAAGTPQTTAEAKPAKKGWASSFMDKAAAATASAMKAAGDMDKKYKISERANKAADSAARKVDQMDKKYKVSEKIDKKAQAIGRSINSFDAKVKAKMAESGTTKT